MRWNKVLLVYDGSESVFRAADFIGKMFAHPENIEVTIMGVHGKVPEHDFAETSPVVEFGLAQHVASMEIEVEQGKAHVQEAADRLVKAGLPAGAIRIKYGSSQKTRFKDIVAELMAGGYGTVVIGKSDHHALIFSGGNLPRDLLAHMKDRAFIAV